MVEDMSMSELHDETKQTVYDELGEQVERIDTVLEAFEENGLGHTEAYESMSQRRARFCTMRGHLNQSSDGNLRGSDGECND